MKKQGHLVLVLDSHDVCNVFVHVHELQTSRSEHLLPVHAHFSLKRVLGKVPDLPNDTWTREKIIEIEISAQLTAPPQLRSASIRVLKLPAFASVVFASEIDVAPYLLSHEEFHFQREPSRRLKMRTIKKFFLRRHLLELFEEINLLLTPKKVEDAINNHEDRIRNLVPKCPHLKGVKIQEKEEINLEICSLGIGISFVGRDDATFCSTKSL